MPVDLYSEGDLWIAWPGGRGVGRAEHLGRRRGHARGPAKRGTGSRSSTTTHRTSSTAGASSLLG
jgi:hypothetical protein